MTGHPTLSLALVLGVALAGGAGSIARFLLDRAVPRVRRFPLGIVVINVTGSLLLGLVTGLALRGLVAEEWRAVLGTGFLGGFTTFSTASVDTVRLLLEGRRAAAALHLVGTAGLACAAAAVGLWLATV